MIRITYIDATEGKPRTQVFQRHDKAAEAFAALAKPGMCHCATMTSGGRIMRAFASASFTRAQDRSTWATP